MPDTQIVLVGDEIVLHGQVVGRLLPPATGGTSINEYIGKVLMGEFDDGYSDDPLDDCDDDELVDEIINRSLVYRVLRELDDDEIEAVLARRRQKRAA